MGEEIWLTLQPALRHDVGGRGQQNHEVEQSRREHGGNGRQRRPPVRGGQQAVEAQEGRVPRVGDGQHHGRRGLEGEVDGEELRLDGGELRALQGLEHDNAADEGLRERLGPADIYVGVREPAPLTCQTLVPSIVP